MIPVMIGIVLVIIVAAGGILVLQRSEDDPLLNRIDEFAAREEIVSIEEIELSMPLRDRILVPIARRVGEFFVRLTPQKTLENTTKLLELAGTPNNMSPATFMSVRVGMTIFFGVMGFFFLSNYTAQGVAQRLMWSIVSAFLGYILPVMWLRAKVDRRKDAVIKKLPDALDLMTICVDAGLTFNAAMQKVDEKWDDPLANEFGRVIYEMQLGKSRRQSLKDMSDRMDVPDVTSFLAAVLQADQLGVGIGKVLRIQSEQMRVRRRQRAEEKAQQAPVKMMFPMVFLIFPSIFVVLLGPAGFQLMRNEAIRNLN